MDDISKGLQAASEVVRAAPGWLDSLLGTLDKYNLLPMSDSRKKNMLEKADIELKLDEQKKAHTRAMEMADAYTHAQIALMEGSPKLALDAAQKRIGDGDSFQHAFQTCVPFALRAASNLYKETLENEYAKERIGLYAVMDAVTNPDMPVSGAGVHPTWQARFWEHAKGIRDEEAMEQWGKLLAGEIKKPGSISLRTLDILRNLDQPIATLFTKLFPYVLNNGIFFNQANDIINEYSISVIETYGLIMKGKGYKALNIEHLSNDCYAIEFNTNGREILIPAIALTPSGLEIYKLHSQTKENSRGGVDYIHNFLKENYNIPSKKIEIVLNKK